MALTAGSPVFRGKLVDTDTRWDVISASVDCRTPIERGISTEVSVMVWVHWAALLISCVVDVGWIFVPAFPCAAVRVAEARRQQE